MGLFDRFRRRPTDDAASAPSADAPTAPSPAAPSSPYLQIDEDAWDDMDEEARMQWCMKQFEILKGAYGGDGKLKRVTADDKLILRTTFEDRPVSIEVDYDTGWFFLKMKFVNRRGHLVLHYDEDKKLSHTDSDQGDDGQWEDDGNDEITHVFAPGIYLEEYEAEARPMIERVAALPGDARDALFDGLRRQVIDRLFVDAETVESGMHRSIYEMRDPKAELDRAFEVMLVASKVFGQGSAQVGPKARVYMHGQPVFPNGAPARQSCGYCGTNFSVSDDPRCPSCGAAA